MGDHAVHHAVQGLRHYLIAVQFFTRLPVTGRLAQWVGFSPAMLSACSAHFPGIGWIAAAVACASYSALALALAWSPWAGAVAAVGCCAATALLTGGFHEDGLADVGDGLGGSVLKERALEIMKDSRIGSYGALTLTLTLMGKCALLALLGAHSLGAALTALVGAHVLSRLWPLLIVRSLPYVGVSSTSKSKPLIEQISTGALAAAVLWSIPALALVWQAQTAIFLIAGCVVSLFTAWRLQRLFAQRLQGITGDCLGATQQISEVGFYLGAAMALGWM